MVKRPGKKFLPRSRRRPDYLCFPRMDGDRTEAEVAEREEKRFQEDVNNDILSHHHRSRSRTSPPPPTRRSLKSRWAKESPQSLATSTRYDCVGKREAIRRMVWGGRQNRIWPCVSFLISDDDDGRQISEAAVKNCRRDWKTHFGEGRERKRKPAIELKAE